MILQILLGFVSPSTEWTLPHVFRCVLGMVGSDVIKKIVDTGVALITVFAVKERAFKMCLVYMHDEVLDGRVDSIVTEEAGVNSLLHDMEADFIL